MVVLSYLLMTVLMILGLFLIGLILLQRGRGGGLAGAFGGMGGQSAFGTKAGDVFTRITIGVATAWILLCAIGVVVLHNSADRRLSAGVLKDDDKSSKAGVGIQKAAPNDGTNTDQIGVPDRPAPPDQPQGPGAGENQPEAPANAPTTPAEGDKDKVEGEKKAEEKKEEPQPEAAKPADKPVEKVEEKPADAKPEPKPEEKKPEEKKPEQPAEQKPQ